MTMVINHKHRFLFVHIQKTGGTSVTEALFTVEGTRSVGHAHSMIDTLDPTVYSGYHTFCFVRNPFDRLVSWWNMMVRKGACNDFSRYLLSRGHGFSQFLDMKDVIYEGNPDEREFPEAYPKSIAFNQLDYMNGPDGRLAVDFIGRYENLERDFAEVCGRIGLELRLPHANSFPRKPYWHYYNAEDVDKVRSMCKRDLEFFDYEFNARHAKY